MPEDITNNMEEKSFGRGRILQDRIRVNVPEDIKMDDIADKMNTVQLDGNIADNMDNSVVGEGGTSTDKSPTIKLKSSEVQGPEQPSTSIFEEKVVSGNMQTCFKSSETLGPDQPEEKRTSGKETSDKPNESCKNQGTDQSVSSKKTVVPIKQKQLQYIDCPTGPIPATKIDAAEEFRSDVAIKDTPISKNFFCCVCGCPTGTGYYYMCKWNHGPVCVLCQKELSLDGCPVYLGQPGQMFDRKHFCRFQLKKIMSTFRDFMLENTIVGCRFQKAGCTYEGPWKKVKKHQQACEFDKKT